VSRLATLAGRARHPKTTVRWRLTLLYGGLLAVLAGGLLFLLVPSLP